MNTDDLAAEGLLNVTRYLVTAVQMQADLIAVRQAKTTTCAADGCWVLLDETCPACAYRAKLRGGVR